MKLLLPVLATLCIAACARVPPSVPSAAPSPPVAARTAPFADYHQHLVSPGFAPIAELPQRDAKALLAMLDAAGIERAVVLSVAYSFADERKKLPNPDALSTAENDWTSAQVTSSNGRLVGFCSANPLREAALAEMERCLRLPGMRGIKLHVGNSGLSFRNADHVTRLGAWFGLAQRRGVPILIHMRPRGGADYGAADVPVFLDKLVARAPDVPIIVAHLGASSPGYPDQNDEVMGAFAAAAERHSPLMRNVYFDVAANLWDDSTPDNPQRVAARMRQIGIDRFLYGTDLSSAGGSIASAWQYFRKRLPLTDAEFAQITGIRLLFDR
jgi:predicted TIM-barrel fold metal-dependent hydrolase